MFDAVRFVPSEGTEGLRWRGGPADRGKRWALWKFQPERDFRHTPLAREGL